MFQEFSEFKDRYLLECKQCGTCFKRCDAYRKTKIPVFLYLKDFFQNYTKSSEIMRFLSACTYCKAHDNACVNHIDLSILLPALKFTLSKKYPWYTWVPANTPSFAAKFLRTARFFYFIRYLTQLLIPREFRAKFEEYRQPKQRDVVLFSGCGIQALENQYFTILDIFQKLKINFGLIEGSYRKPICCGVIAFETGNFNYGLFLLSNLIEELKKFGTKKVIVYCASCYYGLKKIAPQLLNNFDFKIMHASGYLAEVLRNKGKSLLHAPGGKSQVFTIHDSCHLAHSGDTESIRNLLAELPDTKIVEMKHNKENALCDAGILLKSMQNPFSLFSRNYTFPIIAEAMESNAAALCSLCPGCHTILTLFSADIMTIMRGKTPKMPVKNWVSILGEYLGIKRRDLLTYRLSHLVSSPFQESGLWFLWQAVKALVNGYFGRRTQTLDA
jgi:Fe-S oxidoreductase